MNSEIVIVGAKDRELERLLGAINLRTSLLPVSELAMLAHAAAHQPDVVVVDLRGGQALPPAVATLKRQHPSTPVLLVTSTLEPAVVLEAMRAGVNECVAEPLQAAEIETAVTRLLAHKQPVATGQVFAFIGARFKRPLLVGLIFIFGWEQAALAFPGYLKKFTVAYYLQAMVPHAMPNDNVISLIQGIFRESPGLVESLVWLTVILAVFLWSAAVSVERKEYVLEQ